MSYRDELMKKVCEIIKKTKSENGLTQEEMAEKMVISPRTYADIEGKRSLCHMDTFFKYLVFCSNNPDEDIEELKKFTCEFNEDDF